MRNRRLIVIGVAVIILLASWQLVSRSSNSQPKQEPVIGDVPASKAKEYSFDLTEAVQLEFAEVAGNITVYTAPAGPVKAIVTKRSFGTDKESAQREVASFSVEPQQKGQTISFGMGSAARPRRTVDYKITTPPDASVKVKTGSGSITISGLKGAIDINGQNVNVTLSDIRGPITIVNETGNLKIADTIGETNIKSKTSSIQIDRLTAAALAIATGANTVLKDSGSDGKATFNIQNGDLTLTRFRAGSLTADVPKGQLTINESGAQTMNLKTQAGRMNLFRVSADELHATTTTGGISMDQTQGAFDIKTQGTVDLTEARATTLNVAAGSGNVTFYGALPTEGEHSIKTSSGNISVFVVKESAFRLDASTKGTFTLDPPFVLDSAENSAGRWRGVVNQGTILLVLGSTSGNILISSQQY